MLKQKTNEKTTNIFLQTGETIGYYGVMFSMAYNTIWYNTIQNDAIQNDTIQSNTKVYCIKYIYTLIHAFL